MFPALNASAAQICGRLLRDVEMIFDKRIWTGLLALRWPLLLTLVATNRRLNNIARGIGGGALELQGLSGQSG